MTPPSLGPVHPDSQRNLPAFIEEVRASAEFAAGVRAALATMPAGPDPETLFLTAQAVFEADVARNHDIKNHIALRRVRQNERLLRQRDRNLEWRRFQFQYKTVEAVLAHFAELKNINADRALPNQAKIDAVRQCLFGEPPKEDTTLLVINVPDESHD